MIVVQKMAERLHQLIEDSRDTDFVDSPSKMRSLRAAADGLASVVIGLIEDEKNETRQIIRTVGELEVLDPDALVATTFTTSAKTLRILPAGHLQENRMHSRLGHMVVIATGEQVRAARAALEEA